MLQASCLIPTHKIFKLLMTLLAVMLIILSLAAACNDDESQPTRDDFKRAFPSIVLR